MRASSALLHKKQSSTCKKHACGCFLLAPWICSAYFQKGWFKPATDGGGFSFTMFWALLKTRSQSMYKDVHWLTAWLYRTYNHPPWMAVFKTLSSFLRSKNTRDKKCTWMYIFYRSSKLFFIAPPSLVVLNLFGNFSFRTGYLEMRCSKSCYLRDLELDDLFDNSVIEQV